MLSQENHQEATEIIAIITYNKAAEHMIPSFQGHNIWTWDFVDIPQNCCCVCLKLFSLTNAIVKRVKSGIKIMIQKCP